MAISDVLLETELTYKTHLDKGGGEGELKSKDFREDAIYGWLLCIKKI